MESLRRIADSPLWVSDEESAFAAGHLFAVVIDCTGMSEDDADNVHSVPPSGSTNHAWTPEDLDKITKLAKGPLQDGKRVLVHCRRGVSRSPCAAAAILLAQGMAKSVDDALSLTKFQDMSPASQSVAGLRRWWENKRQPRLF